MTASGYKTLVSALKRQRSGMTAADMAAATALPLAVIGELIPRAADEYRARLEVTESGEILYSFPRGFSSRYRNAGAVLGRFAGKIRAALVRFLAAAFKVWIMVMLAGYFILFLLIALAAVVFVFAASASSSNSRNERRNSGGDAGGAFLFSRIIGMAFRFWFYSNIFGSGRQAGGYRRAGERKGNERPLYRQIFSFVFGDGDPNAGWAEREAKEVIAYLRGRKGVIALPEFMALTGLEPARAEREILAYCVRYGGMPEAAEDGAVVYRFDPLLPAAQRKEEDAALKPPRKTPWVFSANKPNANAGFAVINGVNLAFGLYFLYFTLNLGKLAAGHVLGGSFLFVYVHNILARAGLDPAPVTGAALGAVPLVFSLLFWLIPALRRAFLKRKNAAIQTENARKAACVRIWEKPLDVTEEALGAVCEGGADTDRLIREIGAYSVPEVSVDARGRAVYAFTGIAEERAALEKYRDGIGDGTGELGKVVFDSA
jgi:hypothetical protein